MATVADNRWDVPILWNTANTFVHICKLHTLYYLQNCRLDLLRWGYGSSEAVLHVKNPLIHLAYYEPSSEWKIIRTYGCTETNEAPGIQPFEILRVSVCWSKYTIWSLIKKYYEWLQQPYCMLTLEHYANKNNKLWWYLLTVEQVMMKFWNSK